MIKKELTYREHTGMGSQAILSGVGVGVCVCGCVCCGCMMNQISRRKNAARPQNFVATSVYRVIIQRQGQLQLSPLSRIIYCDS